MLKAGPKKSTKRKSKSKDSMKGMSVKSGHLKEDEGMSGKGRREYNRRTGGNLKPPAPNPKKGSKDAKRRKSFCARTKGQMKKFPKAAKNPNSRLRKARRNWNC